MNTVHLEALDFYKLENLVTLSDCAAFLKHADLRYDASGKVYYHLIFRDKNNIPVAGHMVSDLPIRDLVGHVESFINHKVRVSCWYQQNECLKFINVEALHFIYEPITNAGCEEYLTPPHIETHTSKFK